MKLTKSQLKQIIKEELQKALRETQAAVGLPTKFTNQELLDIVTANIEDGTVASYDRPQMQMLISIMDKRAQNEPDKKLRDLIKATALKALSTNPNTKGRAKIRARRATRRHNAARPDPVSDYSQHQGGLYGVNENKMKITKSQLRQIIKEELEKVSEITSLKRTRKAGLPVGDFTNYELEDIETDKVMVDLLRQVVDEIRELNEFMRNLSKPGHYEKS